MQLIFRNTTTAYDDSLNLFDKLHHSLPHTSRTLLQTAFYRLQQQRSRAVLLCPTATGMCTRDAECNPLNGIPRHRSGMQHILVAHTHMHTHTLSGIHVHEHITSPVSIEYTYLHLRTLLLLDSRMSTLAVS
ncbi:unnamed protein product [Ceratitis capitata]|uniref:(Mediterranean fruit fly) hypothetical protein n=1 Tax=Ceratitis capitata TaxID=7213 RepID=A0A811UWR6_CERCA|nr:unnamed protein product [Ceratitis capitata]